MSKQNCQERLYQFPYHYIPSIQPFKHYISGAWFIEYINFFKFLKSDISKISFNSLIEIGCGDGRLTNEIKKEFPNKDVLGVDISENAISFAKAFAKDNSIKFIYSDIKDINKKYDLLLLIEVLEHVELSQRDSFLENLINLMHKDSILYITVPHINRKMDSRHYEHFTEQTLSKLLSDKFEIIETKYLAKKHFIVKWIYNLLENDFFILKHQTVLEYLSNLYYKKFLFTNSEKDCLRLFIKVKRK